MKDYRIISRDPTTVWFWCRKGDEHHAVRVVARFRAQFTGTVFEVQVWDVREERWDTVIEP